MLATFSRAHLKAIGMGCFGLLSFLFWGCIPSPPPAGTGLLFCQSQIDCPKNQVCSMNLCQPAPQRNNPEAPPKEPSQEQPPDGSPPDEPLCPGSTCPSCKTDRDCGTGEICDGKRCRNGCRRDDDCKEGICNAGSLTCQECNKNEDCKDGQLCRETKCAPCKKDLDCADDQLCLDNRCTQGNCRKTADCKGGKRCKSNQCSDCQKDEECEGKELCIFGSCAPNRCRKREDCPEGLLCSSTSKCASCQDDKACGAGQLCINTLCVQGICRKPSDCKGGQICKGNNCIPCEYNADCDGNGKICVAGKCIEGDCKANNDCSAGRRCVQNKCSGCGTDKDCGTGKLCIDGKCADGECRNEDDCKGQACKANKCVPCKNSLDCTQERICDTNKGTCIQGNCRNNSDCTGGEICKANKCSNCTNKSECPTGTVCAQGLCQNGNCATRLDCITKGQLCKSNQCTDCIADNECENGEICVSGKCIQGNCRNNNDCSGGEVCKSNQCSKCTAKSDCLAEQVCDQGICKNGNCITNSDCTGGKLCKINKCSDCVDSTECGTGRVCDNGSCKVGDCVKNSDCSGGQLCTNNNCSPCTGNDCPTGQVCQSNICVSGACSATEPCTNGLVCDNNQCIACAQNGECGAGRICDNGVCKTGDCVATSDCNNGQVCSGNRCSACTANRECIAGQVCQSGTCAPCTQKSDCDSGQVCDLGTCQVGECVQDTDCKDFKSCQSYQCKTCTQSNDCHTQGTICRSGQCLVTIETTSGAIRWKDGTHAIDCAHYRFPPAGYIPATQSGLYWIKPTSASKAYQVHCDMLYAGGGWTLTLKAKGDQQTFQYNSNYWTNTQTYQPNKPDLDEDEAKLESFSQVEVGEILLAMRKDKNKPLRRLIARKQASSMRSLFAAGNNQTFDVTIGRPMWRVLVENNSLQAKCNQEGININRNSINLRLGFIANEQDDCNTPDSFIGIGANDGEVRHGNRARYNTDNGDKKEAYFAYVYVRKLPPTTLALQQVAGTYQPPSGTTPTYAKSCLEYRLPPYSSQQNGLYRIQPAPSASSYRVYCDMTRQGGGWSLALKADGNKTTFAYEKNIWTSTNSYNSTQPNFDTNEARLNTYRDLRLREALVVLNTSGTNRHLVVAKQATSLYRLFQPGKYVAFDYPLGRFPWQNLMGSSGQLQRQCGKDGFNVQANSRHARVRIGVIGNEYDNCNYTDSRIGIGARGQSCNQNNNNSVGNVARCNGNRLARDTKSFGYLFVRE